MGQDEAAMGQDEAAIGKGRATVAFGAVTGRPVRTAGRGGGGDGS
ncbi:hypothetical protein SALCHL_003481 [Streptomyces albus subsp. chlorinus]